MIPWTGKALVSSAGWKSIGVRMAYCSGSVALAALEALVHFDTDIVPNDLALLAVEIPLEVSVAALRDEALPARWREYLVTRETEEQVYAHHRQLFLTEQGYSYRIADESEL